MSANASIEINQAQLNAVVAEFERLKKNMTSNVRPKTIDYMDGVWDYAIERTHWITHELQAGWKLTDTQNANTINVLLSNQVPYAQEEFERPGVKESVGTEHDVRPDIQDFALSGIERAVFNALTEGLR